MASPCRGVAADIAHQHRTALAVTRRIGMTARWVQLFALLLGAAIGVAARADTSAPYLFVLGVAQDAGYPQSGCYEPHCIPGWRDPRLRRGAVSLALIDPSASEKFLFEATPDFPAQLYDLEREAPSDRFRLGGIFLTHAHIGHYAGLMFLGHEAMGAAGMPVYSLSLDDPVYRAA